MKKNTLIERKTVIDLRKAVMEEALPLTEPETKLTIQTFTELLCHTWEKFAKQNEGNWT